MCQVTLFCMILNYNYVNKKWASPFALNMNFLYLQVLYYYFPYINMHALNYE